MTNFDRVHQLEQEANQQGRELIELRADAKQLGVLFHEEAQVAEDLCHELNRHCSQTRTGGVRRMDRDVALLGSQDPPFCTRTLLPSFV